MKQLEQAAMALPKQNPRVKVHVLCAGFFYGHGEQNDIFYEFFRRAWVSLHPDLASLPIIGKGENKLPTVHVQDAARAIDLVLLASIRQLENRFEPYLIAVDDSVESGSTQASIMQAISEGIGSGATKQMSKGEVLGQSWCEFLQIDVHLKRSASI
jgi:nucleoside-diphosphate-sugar epimerase